MDAYEPTSRRHPDLLAFVAALAALVLLVGAFAAVAALNDPDDEVAATSPNDEDDDAGTGSGGLVGEIRVTDDHAHDDGTHDDAAHDDGAHDDGAHEGDDHGDDAGSHAHGPTAQPASAPAPTSPPTVAPTTDCTDAAATTTTTTTTTTTVPHHGDGHHLVTGPPASPVALLATAACDPAASGATTTSTAPTTTAPTTTTPTTVHEHPPVVDPCRQWDDHQDHDGDAHEDGPPAQFADLVLCYPEVAYQIAVATKWATDNFPTARDAAAGGFPKLTKYFPGIAAHYINLGRLFDGKPFSPSTNAIEVLLYDGDGPDANLVGLNWIVFNGDSPPEGFDGPWDMWHEHKNLCLRNGLVIAEEPSPVCREPGVTILDFSGYWLLHVWSIPGWESPEGIFSHENSKLT